MKTNTIIWCAALAAATLCPGIAAGQSISTTFNSASPSLVVNGRLLSSASYSNYNSGVMNFDNVTFDAFCVDPFQSISSNQSLTYQIQDISTLQNSAIISRLVGGFLASSQNASQAAAVQWAIWEVLAETSTSYSLSNGAVKISSTSSATRDLANTYLANQASFTGVQLTYLTNSKSQDMVTWQVVPEPTSAALCAISSLLLLRRRRK
ncbi:MAG: hypothetical protein NWT08_12255 [Akkermansiaceae bacterium]|jgi:hypothetical protein|nr:hypothetical protein [Akkermansiaceae bacterium]MDP4721789.1 hypothetical protein [Akkermansiaceae bacterium]MDP4847375.1 hypothetical protein [Akkermansiaceae bacterium]MDP4897691.1 hypothetical protein [Akkermansiaceae bacterium]MDP4997236.1 hypothetical protein [Akkermansiaceae bacterium]